MVIAANSFSKTLICTKQNAQNREKLLQLLGFIFILDKNNVNKKLTKNLRRAPSELQHIERRPRYSWAVFRIIREEGSMDVSDSSEKNHTSASLKGNTWQSIKILGQRTFILI